MKKKICLILFFLVFSLAFVSAEKDLSPQEMEKITKDAIHNELESFKKEMNKKLEGISNNYDDSEIENTLRKIRQENVEYQRIRVVADVFILLGALCGIELIRFMVAKRKMKLSKKGAI